MKKKIHEINGMAAELFGTLIYMAFLFLLALIIMG